MSEEFNKLVIESVPNQEKSNELIGRLFEVARPSAVFSEPVTNGPYTVITASEVTVGMGAGYGGGGGVGGNGNQHAEGEKGTTTGTGFGGGGGGGGSALARPVAAIIIEPDGVRVEPIVDPTKIALAFFTTLLSIIMALSKGRKKG
ncbi:MAG: hypothetical protein H6658_01520 [Ardenticatenaceae bacterium]|nr:hypothetical protein [Ardenticatenaceae bacterium]